YDAAGTYALTGTNAAGCDTVHHLTIVVDPIIEMPMTASICEGSSYDFFGTTLTAAGTYTHTSTSDPCDTLYTLTLTVDPIIETYATETICAGGSFVWAGVTYDAAGTYDLAGTNAAGCDTVHHLTIVVDPIIEVPMSASMCEGSTYMFFGTALTAPGTYTHTSTSDPCDTLYILTLTVDPLIETYATETICEGGSFVWAGV